MQRQECRADPTTASAVLRRFAGETMPAVQPDLWSESLSVDAIPKQEISASPFRSKTWRTSLTL
jgi:hypothetical protein